MDDRISEEEYSFSIGQVMNKQELSAHFKKLSKTAISINTSYQFATKDCFLSLCFFLASF
jgi:hypothetical protein